VSTQMSPCMVCRTRSVCAWKRISNATQQQHVISITCMALGWASGYQMTSAYEVWEGGAQGAFRREALLAWEVTHHIMTSAHE
jgi:hypothetical protein